MMVFCDNSAMVEIINKGRSKIKIVRNGLVQRLTWTCFLNNFILRASFTPGAPSALSFSF